MRDRDIAVSDYYQKITEQLDKQDKDCFYYLKWVWIKFPIDQTQLPKTLYEEGKN